MENIDRTQMISVTEHLEVAIILLFFWEIKWQINI